jgi:hypothetical protein
MSSSHKETQAAWQLQHGHAAQTVPQTMLTSLGAVLLPHLGVCLLLSHLEQHKRSGVTIDCVLYICQSMPPPPDLVHVHWSCTLQTSTTQALLPCSTSPASHISIAPPLSTAHCYPVPPPHTHMPPPTHTLPPPPNTHTHTHVPPCPGEMKAVCAGALGIGCIIFMVLALGSIAAFGPSVNANILNNLSATGMAPLIGAAPAAVSGADTFGGSPGGRAGGRGRGEEGGMTVCMTRQCVGLRWACRVCQGSGGGAAMSLVQHEAVAGCCWGDHVLTCRLLPFVARSKWP